MKNFKLVIFSLFLLFFVTVVNAESISVNKVNSDGLNHEFNVSINKIEEGNEINVIEGEIGFDPDLFLAFEITKSNDWYLEQKSEVPGTISFVVYKLGTAAVSGDNLFNVKFTMFENPNSDEIGLSLKKIKTTDGNKIYFLNSFKGSLADFEKNVEVELEKEEKPESDSIELDDKPIENVENIGNIGNLGSVGNNQNAVNTGTTIDKNLQNSINSAIVDEKIEEFNKLFEKEKNNQMVEVFIFVTLLVICILLNRRINTVDKKLDLIVAGEKTNEIEEIKRKSDRHE